MLLTFMVDPPLLVAMGALFAMAVPMSFIAAGGRCLRGRALSAGLLTVTLFNVMVGVAYVRYPDWMWIYLFDTSTFSFRQHLLSGVIVLMAYHLLALAGYCWVIERRQRHQSLRSVCVTLIAVTIATGLAGGRQFWSIGDYFSFHHGDAVPLPQSAFFADYVSGVIALAIAGTLAWRWARREKS